MSQSASPLTVRQHHRFACSLATQVAVAPASADRVKLSRAVLGGATGIASTLRDISSVGAGISSRVYFPVGCKLTLTVVAPDQSSLKLTGSVIRTIMIDRTPTYLVGTVFDASDQPLAQELIKAIAPAIPAPPTAAAESPNPMPGSTPSETPSTGGADARA